MPHTSFAEACMRTIDIYSKDRSTYLLKTRHREVSGDRATPWSYKILGFSGDMYEGAPEGFERWMYKLLDDFSESDRPFELWRTQKGRAQ